MEKHCSYILAFAIWFTGCSGGLDPALCGNGIIDEGETCDHGSRNSDIYSLEATCNSECTDWGPYCGDDVLNGAEECDMGSSNQSQTGNACRGNCTNPICGDAVIDSEFGEVCDGGAWSSDEYGPPGRCNTTCTDYAPHCGDGILRQDPDFVGSYEVCEGPIMCGELGLGSGMAFCAESCIAYDTSQCEIRDMVAVPAGPFIRGCNLQVDTRCLENEFPPHTIYLEAFLIDRTEVTAGAYEECVEAGACEYNGQLNSWYNTYGKGLDNYPINEVNWNEARAYCEWAGKRLPIEAEWEKAARGSRGAIYSWGNVPEPSCDYAIVIGDYPDGLGCGQEFVWEVGSKPAGASPYGALDMVGNLAEWTADDLVEGDYAQAAEEGWEVWERPSIPPESVNRIARGGSWLDYSSSYFLRTSARVAGELTLRAEGLGFRCAKSVD